MIRAQCLKEESLIDYIGWHDVTPQGLREKIFSILDQKERYSEAMSAFKLTGLDTMLERLKFFRNKIEDRPEAAAAPSTSTIRS